MYDRKIARVAHIFTVSLSALLLFLVQPMLAGLLLPRHGGVAGVWAVAMFFFPAVLLLTTLVLARKLGWSWAPLIAWMVLLPLVLSRRSIFKMQGARAAAFLMSLFPAATILMLYFKPRPNWMYFTVRYEFQPAFWATLVLSVVAIVISLRFGGTSRVVTVQAQSPTAKRDPSATLH